MRYSPCGTSCSYPHISTIQYFFNGKYFICAISIVICLRYFVWQYFVWYFAWYFVCGICSRVFAQWYFAQWYFLTALTQHWVGCPKEDNEWCLTQNKAYLIDIQLDLPNIPPLRLLMKTWPLRSFIMAKKQVSSWHTLTDQNNAAKATNSPIHFAVTQARQRVMFASGLSQNFHLFVVLPASTQLK